MDHAQRFYGATAPAHTEAVDTTSPETRALVDKLYGSALSQPPPDVAPGGLYARGSQFQSMFQQHAATLHDVVGLAEAERQEREDAFVDLVEAMALSDDDAMRLFDLAVQEDVAVAKGAAADGTAQMQMAKETMQRLRERYGLETEALVARAQALVRSSPNLQRLLSVGSLGLRPDVNLMLVEHVRRRPH